MIFKAIYKRLVPLRVRKAISRHPWVLHLRQQLQDWKFQRWVKRIRSARNGDAKTRVTFLVQRRAHWFNYASIYEAMKANPAFEVAVIATPKRVAGFSGWNMEEYRQLRLLLTGKDIPFCMGYDESVQSWIDPLEFGLPDLAFMPHPFAGEVHPLYRINYWHRFCKIAYVCYGISMADLPNLQYRPLFFNDCWRIFMESAAHRALFMEYRPELAERLVVTGHPSLDVYRKPVLPEMRRWKLPSARKRIIWAPHFTVTNDRTPHTFSTFFEYYEFFLTYARAHPEIEFVMRPHPELFEHMVIAGLKTREEAMAYWERFNALPNGQVYEGNGIFEMFMESDALILDSLSFLAQYLPTGKPICFLDSHRRQKLNVVGEALLATYYKAWNLAAIEHFIKYVVIDGNDVFKENRVQVFQEYLFMPKLGAGVEIMEYIRKGEISRERSSPCEISVKR